MERAYIEHLRACKVAKGFARLVIADQGLVSGPAQGLV